MDGVVPPLPLTPSGCARRRKLNLAGYQIFFRQKKRHIVPAWCVRSQLGLEVKGKYLGISGFEGLAF